MPHCLPLLHVPPVRPNSPSLISPFSCSEASEHGTARDILLSTDRAGLSAAELADINGQNEIASKLRLMEANLARGAGEATTSGASECAATLQGTNRQLPNKEYSLYYRTQLIVTAEEWVSGQAHASSISHILF